jgi:L-lactate utilization protein LutC
MCDSTQKLIDVSKDAIKAMRNSTCDSTAQDRLAEVVAEVEAERKVKTIFTSQPAPITFEQVDAILDSPGETHVTDLYLIDHLIVRARERGIEVQFSNSERTLNMADAELCRYTLGLDIR